MPHSHSIKNMPEHGYALLTALVVSALIISIATSIASLTVRQLRTHALVSDSLIAQNAAVAGYECAYFWDTDPAVIEDQALGPFYPNSGPHTIRCFGQNLTINTWLGSSYTFAVNVGNEGCAVVTVTKKDSGAVYQSINDPLTDLRLYDTTITADGYNSRVSPPGAATCDTTGDFVVQRTVFVDTY